jgi:ribosome-binding protein aMBF1 (putative translation factor)
MNAKQKKHQGSSFDMHLKESMKDPAFAELYTQEHIKHEISQLVIKARKKAGLTQKQLAELTGLHQAAIARIESRKARTIPGIEILRKILVPLGYNVTLHLHKLKDAA